MLITLRNFIFALLLVISKLIVFAHGTYAFSIPFNTQLKLIIMDFKWRSILLVFGHCFHVCMFRYLWDSVLGRFISNCNWRPSLGRYTGWNPKSKFFYIVSLQSCSQPQWQSFSSFILDIESLELSHGENGSSVYWISFIVVRSCDK